MNYNASVSSAGLSTTMEYVVVHYLRAPGDMTPSLPSLASASICLGEMGEETRRLWNRLRRVALSRPGKSTSITSIVLYYNNSDNTCLDA